MRELNAIRAALVCRHQEMTPAKGGEMTELVVGRSSPGDWICGREDAGTGRGRGGGAVAPTGLGERCDRLLTSGASRRAFILD